MSEDRSIPISPAALEAFAAGAAFMPQSTPAPSADNEARTAEDITEASGSSQPEAMSATEQNDEAPVEETMLHLQTRAFPSPSYQDSAPASLAAHANGAPSSVPTMRSSSTNRITPA